MDYSVPLKVKAYETIKERILSGEIKPNEYYSETKISKELDISRTPIRDALQRLAQERYIDIIPSRGFRIHHLDEEDLINTYQTRCALEGYCVVNLAQEYQNETTQEIFKVLENLLEKQKEVIKEGKGAEEFRKFDSAFHDTIVKSLNNPIISDTFATLNHQMEGQSMLSLEHKGRMAETVEEHSKILENMKKGAVGRSYKAALAHLDENKRLILEDYENKV